MWTLPVRRHQSTVGNVWTTTITRGHGDHMASGFLQFLTTNGDRMAMGGTAMAMAKVKVAKAKLMVARQAMLLGAMLVKAMARAKVKVSQRRNL